MTSRVRDRFCAWYERYKAWWVEFGPLMMGLVVISLIICGVLITQATFTNARQDNDEAKSRAQLAACNDQWQHLNEAYTTITRAASLRARNRTNTNLRADLRFTFSVVGLFHPTSQTAAAHDVLLAARAQLHAKRALLRANQSLTRTFKRYPPLPPASDYCRNGVFSPPKGAPSLPPTDAPRVSPSASPKAGGPVALFSPSPAPSSVPRPPESTAPAQTMTPRPSSRPSPQPSPEPSPVQPTPSPTGGLADLVDNTLKQLGLPPLLSTP